MKARQFIFLPIFLCCAFFFRMGFLSFGPVHSPVASYHRNIAFKRKLLDVSQQRKRDIKENRTDPSCHAVFQFAKSKCVLGKPFRLSLTGFFSKSLTTSHNRALKDRVFPEQKVADILSRRHLLLSVIRV